MTTQLDAFPGLVSLSPKLAWLTKHRLHTRKDTLPRGYIGPANSKPWTCANAARTVVAFGDTEEDACWSWCGTMGVTHWLMEGVELIGDRRAEEGWE